MTITRDSLAAELAARLGDATHAVWSAGDLAGYLDNGIRGLYPTVFLFNSGTTTAGAGPEQTVPSGCRHIHYIGLIRPDATRVRKMRGWSEGSGKAIVPKLGISTQTLVWGWTDGFDAPASGSTALTVPVEGIEILLIRAQISAMEHLLSDRVKATKYLALNIREQTTEQDIAITIDALHASHDERLKHVVPLPVVES